MRRIATLLLVFGLFSGQGTNIASVMWSQDTIGSLSVIESNG